MTNPTFKDRPLARMSPRQRLLLVRIMEEAAEVGQAAAKILRFGPFNFHPLDADRTANFKLLDKESEDLWEAVSEYQRCLAQETQQGEER